MNIKNKSRLSIALGFVLLSCVLVFAVFIQRAHANPTANFTAADNTTVGNGKSWYNSNFSTGVTNISSDVFEILYYLNNSQVGVNNTSSGFTGYSVNAATLATGVYHLSAVAYNLAGQANRVTAADGNTYLTFTVNNAPTAKFTAPDNNVYGNGPGTNSGTVFSTQLNNESSGIVQIAYYLNNVISGVNTKVDGTDGFQVDTSTLSNGVYNLTATLEDSYGDLSNAETVNGNNSLTFTVNNTSSPSTQTCSSQQQNLDTITTRIVKRTESQIQTIDSIAKSVEEYYSQQPQKLSSYAQTVSQLTADENKVQSDAISVVNDSSINCTGDVSSQVASFKSAVNQLDGDISNYINNVQQLISDLENIS